MGMLFAPTSAGPPSATAAAQAMRGWAPGQLCPLWHRSRAPSCPTDSRCWQTFQGGLPADRDMPHRSPAVPARAGRAVHGAVRQQAGADHGNGAALQAREAAERGPAVAHGQQRLGRARAARLVPARRAAALRLAAEGALCGSVCVPPQLPLPLGAAESWRPKSRSHQTLLMLLTRGEGRAPGGWQCSSQHALVVTA